MTQGVLKTTVLLLGAWAAAFSLVVSEITPDDCWPDLRMAVVLGISTLVAVLALFPLELFLLKWARRSLLRHLAGASVFLIAIGCYSRVAEEVLLALASGKFPDSRWNCFGTLTSNYLIHHNNILWYVAACVFVAALTDHLFRFRVSSTSK